MKTLKLIMSIGIIAAFARCGPSKNPALSGVYVNESKGEYSVSKDTLIITAVNLSEKSYEIEDRSTYQRIRNGAVHRPETKIIKWTAIWKTEEQVLTEGEFGRQIKLSPDKKNVMIKSLLFMKIE